MGVGAELIVVEKVGSVTGRTIWQLFGALTQEMANACAKLSCRVMQGVRHGFEKHALPFGFGSRNI